MFLVIKYLITAGLVVAVSEIARHSGRLGALVASLPLVTVMVLIWLKLEEAPQQKIAAHAWYTFWYVLPTLPMFLIFPFLLGRWGFWPALLIGAGLTLICFAILAVLVRRFGIVLW